MVKRHSKFRKILLCVLALALLAAAGYQLYPIVKGCYRELTFYSEDRSDAELAVMAYAQTQGYHYRDYPESLVDLLERNPETEDFVLSYPAEHDQEHTVDLSEYDPSEGVPLFFQWDKRWGYLQYGSDVAGLTACGPVCLSMAAYYLTEDPAMSPDNLIRFAIRRGYCTWSHGTSWTLISEGAVELGFDVTELPLDENRIMANLEAGVPIICVMGPGDFTTTGHYIVLVGTENGLLRVNDPNSRANSEKLWKFEDIEGQFRNLWVIQK